MAKQTKAQLDLEAAAREHVSANPPRTGTGGAQVILPNGVARADYVKQRHNEGATVSVIRAEINFMLEADHKASGAEGKAPVCSYQAVFGTVKRLKEKAEG